MSLLTRLGIFVSLIVLFTTSLCAHAESYENELLKLQTAWATVKYQTPKNKQLAEFQGLIHQAEKLNQQYPHQPRIMVWYATILSSYAANKGGLTVLPDVKKARTLLEEAIHLDSQVEQGFAQGVLGALYARVPGWPIAFGSKDKARQHLQKAVQIDPYGSDSNYYYGDFLVDIGEYQEAKRHLEIALQAPVRESNNVQDRGRKEEIAVSLAKLRRLGY